MRDKADHLSSKHSWHCASRGNGKLAIIESVRNHELKELADDVLILYRHPTLVLSSMLLSIGDRSASRLSPRPRSPPPMGNARLTASHAIPICLPSTSVPASRSGPSSLPCQSGFSLLSTVSTSMIHPRRRSREVVGSRQINPRVGRRRDLGVVSPFISLQLPSSSLRIWDTQDEFGAPVFPILVTLPNNIATACELKSVPEEESQSETAA